MFCNIFLLVHHIDFSIVRNKHGSSSVGPTEYGKRSHNEISTVIVEPIAKQSNEWSSIDFSFGLVRLIHTVRFSFTFVVNARIPHD